MLSIEVSAVVGGVDIGKGDESGKRSAESGKWRKTGRLSR
jgi:hypothetical protein